MKIPFPLPPLSHGEACPVWEGNTFRIGKTLTKILHYDADNRGWDDNLTSFHEETAGDDHFIDCASRNYAIHQIQKHISHNSPTILEIGCSSGFMLAKMQKAFPKANLIGADVVHEPLIRLSNSLPDIPIMRFDLVNCPFPDNCIDVVVMLNVLEHIEDDLTAIRQIYRILKPGGVAILEVPAGPHLYDSYDKVLNHYRRYTLSQLQLLIKQQGFTINKQSHLGFFIYPGFQFIKKRNQRLVSELQARQQTEKNIRSTGKNVFLKLLMQMELFFGRYLSYPIGIRCLISCKKY